MTAQTDAFLTAWTTAEQAGDTRTLDRLRTLQRQARPLRAHSPQLRELDERITDFLSRSSTRQD